MELCCNLLNFKNMKFILSLIASGLIWFVFTPNLFCQNQQTLPPYAIPGTEIRSLKSKYVDDMVYKIDIALPGSYQDNGMTYPTLYVLDSWAYFGFVVQTYRALRYFQEVPEMIIVGISHYGNDITDDIRCRARDYTPTKVDSSLWFPVSGGAPQFFEFIVHELFPMIDEHYRTRKDDRAIFGASAGGIFSTYVLFNHPGAFNRYIIGGPAAWYDQYIVLDYEKAYSEKSRSMPVKLFMTVGSLENELQIQGWTLLKDSIESRNYADLEMTALQIEDEGHVSQALVSIIKGMKMVFK